MLLGPQGSTNHKTNQFFTCSFSLCELEEQQNKRMLWWLAAHCLSNPLYIVGFLIVKGPRQQNMLKKKKATKKKKKKKSHKMLHSACDFS